MGWLRFFKLWCQRGFLRVSWTARRSNQSILKEFNPEYSLEGLMLKLKLQYSGHLMQRTDSLEKTPMLGKIEGGRKRGQQRMRWLDSPTQWTWVWASSRSWWWTGRPGVLQSMRWQRVRHDWATEQKTQSKRNTDLEQEEKIGIFKEYPILMLCGDLNGKEVKKGEVVCICIAD